MWSEGKLGKLSSHRRYSAARWWALQAEAWAGTGTRGLVAGASRRQNGDGKRGNEVCWTLTAKGTRGCIGVGDTRDRTLSRAGQRIRSAVKGQPVRVRVAPQLQKDSVKGAVMVGGGNQLFGHC